MEKFLTKQKYYPSKISKMYRISLCPILEINITVARVIHVKTLKGFFIQKTKIDITKKILNSGASSTIVFTKKYHQGSTPKVLSAPVQLSYGYKIAYMYWQSFPN